MTIKAEIALVVEGVAKKNTQGRTRSKFVGGSGGKVGITLATKNA